LVRDRLATRQLSARGEAEAAEAGHAAMPAESRDTEAVRFLRGREVEIETV
jgi:hypothetical protein